MKLIGSIIALGYFSHVSAVCNDHKRRNHCSADSDCTWIRESKSCAQTSVLSCVDGTSNKKLCGKLSGMDGIGPCQFNIETKDCGTVDTPLNCHYMYTRKGCKGFGGCWFNKNMPGPSCQKDSAKDECSNFDSFRWGCHKLTTGDCVYNTETTECKNFSDATCADYKDSRNRCNKSEKGCKFNNKTGECEGSAPQSDFVHGSSCQTNDQCPEGLHCVSNWLSRKNKICMHIVSYTDSTYQLDAQWYIDGTTTTYWDNYEG